MQYINFINKTGTPISFEDFEICRRVCAVFTQFESEKDFVDFYLTNGFNAVADLYDTLSDFDNAVKECDIVNKFIDKVNAAYQKTFDLILMQADRLDGLTNSIPTNIVASECLYIERVRLEKLIVSLKSKNKTYTFRLSKLQTQLANAVQKKYVFMQDNPVSMDIFHYK